MSLTSAIASPQFHVGHNDFFETTRYNRSSARTKNKWQQLSGIDLAVKLENRDKIKRAALIKVADRSTIETPADVANIMPVFDHTRTASLQSGNLDQVAPSPYQAPTVSEPAPVASVLQSPLYPMYLTSVPEGGTGHLQRCTMYKLFGNRFSGQAREQRQDQESGTQQSR